eukprot:maker-scaffold_1-snap-gene-27.47-mRNA-1 protein AED:0.03 eAED:0.03 QI:138/1/1/1/0.66/0.5/4/121/256
MSKKEKFGHLLLAEKSKRDGHNSKMAGSGQSWERERNGAAFYGSIDNVFEYTFENQNDVVRIREDPGKDIGARVWDVAIQFSKFLEQNRSILLNKSVLEIGAGTGLCGLVAGKLGAEKVVLTDLPRVVPILEEQVSLQDFDVSSVSAKELTWGKNLDEYSKVYTDIDLILLSDMAAPVPEVENLLFTLETLLEVNPDALVLFGMHIHREFSTPFISQAKQIFNVERILDAEFNPKFISDRVELYWMRIRRSKQTQN